MAAAFYNTLAGRSHQAASAGTQPSECLHPEVVAVMQEIGIDLSDAKPQLLTKELAANADMLITMGCGEACPHVPGLKRQDWPFPDPKGKPLDEVRKIRDEINHKVHALVANELTID
jgi:arsenate reductase